MEPSEHNHLGSGGVTPPVAAGGETPPLPGFEAGKLPAPPQAETLAPPVTEERGFAVGELVVLRPVLEGDLPELAKLLAANPCAAEPQPWTLQRLKKQFEEKEKDGSGLWDKQQRHFAVVRKTGGLVGFLKETDDYGAAQYWNRLYIGEQHADRDALGRDALTGYLAYKRKWHNPRRISFDVVKGEPGIGEWLIATGFELEVELEQVFLYDGRPTAFQSFVWLSDEVRANRADDGPVAGEEV